MALMTHQIQGSYTAFSARPVSWRRRMEPKRLLLRSTLVKRKSLLCVGAPLVQRSKGKSLIIVSFKGKNGEPGGKENGSESAKDSADESSVPHDSEEDLASSSKKQNGQLFSQSEADKKLPGPVAIRKLFMSWLTLLHTPSPDLVVDGSLEGPPLLKESSEKINLTLTKERGGEILKVIWFQFLGLDAKKKLPILIIFPFWVAVMVTCGPMTAMDITPSLIVVALLSTLLYTPIILIFKLASKLYAFTFRKTAALMKTSIMAAYDFIASGKLIEKIRVKLWEPMLGITLEIMKWLSLKYVKARVEAWRAGKKAEWDEKFEDYKEEIWPLYCRTIRTLKKAKLI